MGIYDFYFKWLRASDFVNVFLQNLPPNVSSLSIDANSIVHNCAQLVYGYGDLWKNKYGITKGAFLKEQRLSAITSMSDQELEQELFISIGNKVLELVAAVNPMDYLFFAIDGTIPQSKIVQQRSRRFKNTKKEKPEEKEVESIVPLSDIASKMRFDTNSITPGTNFMIRLDQYLLDFFRRSINQLTRTVYYSPHTIRGEGEHKIMDFFRAGKIKGDGYHVIYGLDTDLIMLTMGLNISNIVLWRDDILEKLYIDNFKFELAKKMGNSPRSTDDFILIMAMAGNDFLPAVPTIEDFEVSINAMINIYDVLYKTKNLTYTTRVANRVEINWDNFQHFLDNLREYEAYFLNLKLKKDYIKKDSITYATTNVNESGERVDIPFNYNKFRNYWYNNEFAPRGNRNNILKYVKPESLNITIDMINDMAADYVNGINWIIEYYFNGWKGLNLKWYYKYYHSPLFLDIFNFVAVTVKTNDMSKLSMWKPATNNTFPNVFEQLLSVLPPSSAYLLPEELRFLMNNNSPISDYYPIDYLIDYELKDKDYKGIPILPFVNPFRIMETYSNYVKFGLERDEYIKYFSMARDKTWTRAASQDKIICGVQQVKSELKQYRAKDKSTIKKGQGRKLLTPQTEVSAGPFNSIPSISYKK